MSENGSDLRPLSPFTTVWRWHVTMVTSILHRASGVALVGGVMVLVTWLYAAAQGPESYSILMALMASWPGRALLFGFTLALCFHLLNGVRYLMWDIGHGYEKQTADRTAWFAIVGAALLTLALWAFAYWRLDLLSGQFQGGG